MKESTISIPANCFNPKSYVKSHPATGLLSTRSGDRLIAVPELLLKIIPKTLREEAGEASYLALYTFGQGWGKTFCGRLVKDIAQYYRQPISEIFSADFLVYVQEAWAVHGLGKLSIDFSLSEQGFLVAIVENSAMGITNHDIADYRSFSLEAGFLAGWFSTLTGQELRVSASNWNNPQVLQFLVGTIPQIEEIELLHLQKGMLTAAELRSL